MGKQNRREFLNSVAQGTALAASGGLAWYYLLHEQAQAAAYAIVPPGAEDRELFYNRCIKCGQCVQACPFDTLSLAAAGQGVPIGSPYFVPRDTPCYLCVDIPCVAACPTGALNPELTDVEQARMGLATIDIENCLSWQGLRCEICHRECPVQDRAITVEHHPRRLSKHAMFVPVVHSDQCTGCGVCEQACPTELAAIRVVQPELVQGKLGDHYRLGWKSRTPITQEFKPHAGGTGAANSDRALDYLNQGPAQ